MIFDFFKSSNLFIPSLSLPSALSMFSLEFFKSTKAVEALSETFQGLKSEVKEAQDIFLDKMVYKCKAASSIPSNFLRNKFQKFYRFSIGENVISNTAPIKSLLTFDRYDKSVNLAASSMKRSFSLAIDNQQPISKRLRKESLNEFSLKRKYTSFSQKLEKIAEPKIKKNKIVSEIAEKSDETTFLKDKEKRIQEEKINVLSSPEVFSVAKSPSCNVKGNRKKFYKCDCCVSITVNSKNSTDIKEKKKISRSKSLCLKKSSISSSCISYSFLPYSSSSKNSSSSLLNESFVSSYISNESQTSSKYSLYSPISSSSFFLFSSSFKSSTGNLCANKISPAKFRRKYFIVNKRNSIKNFYKIERKKLGQGAYGSVCRAVHKTTKCVRAVKAVFKAKLKCVHRLKQEIEIMKTLDHPNIVKLYETYEDRKNVYLLLELCEGGELFDRLIEVGCFTEEAAKCMMRQILSAVYYCHKRNVVHRDLKPENILFLNKTETSPLKIIDFGLAAKGSSECIYTTLVGTPYYVSPQILENMYTSKCDIWSVGVILYVLLSGNPPFSGKNDHEILKNVKRGKFSLKGPDWCGVSKSAKNLILRLLSYNPDDRPTAKEALNHPWMKINNGFRLFQQPQTTLVNRIMDNFRAFQAFSKFKKVVLTVIAQNISESEIVDLKNIFMSLDENGDGTLTIQEIRKCLFQSPLTEVPQDFEEVFNNVDSDGSGVIDYTEFIAAALDKKQYFQESVYWEAFNVFDLDGNGKISNDEILKVLCGGESQNICDDDLMQANLIITEYDINGDEHIDFQEFMDIMKTNP